MVKLVYTGRLKKIQAAVSKANEILFSPQFYDKIRQQSRFDFTELSPSQIADIMEQADYSIRVESAFKPIANASTSSAELITLSSIRFSRHLPTAVNTLVHETVHAIDFLNGELEFTHDGNSSAGQERTAPWVIGEIAEKMVSV